MLFPFEASFLVIAVLVQMSQWNDCVLNGNDGNSAMTHGGERHFGYTGLRKHSGGVNSSDIMFLGASGKARPAFSAVTIRWHFARRRVRVRGCLSLHLLHLLSLASHWLLSASSIPLLNFCNFLPPALHPLLMWTILTRRTSAIRHAELGSAV